MGENQDQNAQNALEFMKKASQSNVDIICFPELTFDIFFPQYPTEVQHFSRAKAIPGDLVAKFQKAATEYNMVTIINLYEKGDLHGEYYDTSPIIDSDGKLLGKVRMTHVCEEKSCHEKFYYWEPTSHTAFQVFDTHKGKIGVSICYDRHFPEIYRHLALEGAELILTPTAITTHEPIKMYEIELQAHSFDNQVYTAFCNRVGKEDALKFCGNSFVVDPEGSVIARAQSLEEELLIVDLGNMDSNIRQTRNKRFYLRDLRKDLY
ncbi:MAG: carbon-nitrogen hydrolase family protein [Candidatus Heimdallarchaeota archaeon]|nr:carbon-nitrogen hydrolase family protein [Candidatus Heimdallarchaeota archaeon]